MFLQYNWLPSLLMNMSFSLKKNLNYKLFLLFLVFKNTNHSQSQGLNQQPHNRNENKYNANGRLAFSLAWFDMSLRGLKKESFKNSR